MHRFHILNIYCNCNSKIELFQSRNQITVNSLYNDHVCSKLSLTIKWMRCYKEMSTIHYSTKFPNHNQLVKENIIQMNLNALLFRMYTSLQFHHASKCTKLTSYQMWQNPIHAKDLVLNPNWLTHSKNSVNHIYIFFLRKCKYVPRTYCGCRWVNILL